MATDVAASTTDFVSKCRAMAMDMLRLPTQQMWVDYDEEADVLYMSFRRPQKATKTIEVEEDVLLRKDGRTIVGMTILNASSRGGRPKRRRLSPKIAARNARLASAASTGRSG